MNLTFVTYTHSEYSDIWPLVLDGVKHLDSLPIMKVLFCNTDDVGPDIHAQYHRVIVYDDTQTYPERVASCLEKLDTKYVFFVHDIDIIVNFDIQYFKEVFDVIQYYTIHRFFFGMVQPCPGMIHNGWLSIAPAKHSPIFSLPYDVGPSIWDRTIFLTLMRKHNKETYRTIETSPIQTDMLDYTCYAMTTSPFHFPLFHLARPMSNKFTFLHILAGGKWFDPICYMDLQIHFFELLERNNISMEVREMGSGFHLFQISRSLEYHS